MLVMIGARKDGTKELLAVSDGERESALSWRELLLDLKQRGMTDAPLLAIADGALGFWKACAEVWPSTRQQICWVHKTANVLDKLPKKLHGAAKEKLHAIYMAPSKADARAALAMFKELYGSRYPRAVDSLERVQDQLLTFFDFPAAHWQHIRSTNVIESTFGTIRHRQRRTKGNGSRKTALAMVYKLAKEAEKSWRRLRNPAAVGMLLAGARYVDGAPIFITADEDQQRRAE